MNSRGGITLSAGEHPASLLSRLNAFISTSERKNSDLLKENTRLLRELAQTKALKDKLTNDNFDLKEKIQILEKSCKRLEMVSEKRLTKITRLKEFHRQGLKILEEDEEGLSLQCTQPTETLPVNAVEEGDKDTRHHHHQLLPQSSGFAQLVSQMARFEDKMGSMMGQISNLEDTLEISLINQGQINSEYEEIIMKIRKAEERLSRLGRWGPETDGSSDEDDIEMPDISTDAYGGEVQGQMSAEIPGVQADGVRESREDNNCFESVSEVFMSVNKVENLDDHDERDSDDTEYIRRNNDGVGGDICTIENDVNRRIQRDFGNPEESSDCIEGPSHTAGDIQLNIKELVVDDGTTEVYVVDEESSSDEDIQVVADLRQKESEPYPSPKPSTSAALRRDLIIMTRTELSRLGHDRNISNISRNGKGSVRRMLSDLGRKSIDYEAYEVRRNPEVNRRASTEIDKVRFLKPTIIPCSRPGFSRNKYPISVYKPLSKVPSRPELERGSTGLIPGVKVKMEHRLDGFHDKMWKCHCGHKTRSKPGIMNHIIKRNPEGKKWRCITPNCDEYFHHVHLVTRHLQRKHDSYIIRLYGCYECYNIFETSREQREHRNKENKKCYKGPRVNRKGKQRWTPAAIPRTTRNEPEVIDMDNEELCTAYPSIVLEV